MMRGLLEKELRQHGTTLAFLGLFLLGALALIGGHETIRAATGGGFAPVAFLLKSALPLACLVLAQLLIATEFRQKTQLFLEGLPLPRWRMLAVKFALGLAVIITLLGAVLGLAWWQARQSEAMTPRFAALLMLKALGWTWFFYTLCFAHAFLGRYRVVFGVALLFGLLFATQTITPLEDFGPFALLDDRFGYERFIVPWRALAETAGLGLALAALGFALGLVRDASIAGLLAERMSAREKMVMTLLLFLGLLAVGHNIEQREKTAPVQMPGAVEAARGVVRVVAAAAVDAPSREETATLEAVARELAEELGALAEYLGCRTFPPVFVVHRRDLAAGERIAGRLKPEQGVLVRTNLLAPDFPALGLHPWLIRETLRVHTGGFAGRERNAWVLDGCAAWWPRSQRGAEDALDAAPARAAMPAGFSPQSLQAWFSLRQKVGESAADRLAASGLAVLGQRHGAEKRRQFLATTLGTARPQDARGWLRDVRAPTSTQLRAATGAGEAEFVAEWRAALEADPR